MTRYIGHIADYILRSIGMTFLEKNTKLKTVSYCTYKETDQPFELTVL